MIYHDCEECGGKCCKNFSVPMAFSMVLHSTGVPIGLFKSELDMNPRRYFELHDGVTISEDGCRAIIAGRIKIEPRGRHLLVNSVCTMLSPEGRCMDYDNRPDMCKNFTKATMNRYIVPDGCKYTAVE